MLKTLIIASLVALTILAAGPASAQEKSTDRVTVELIRYAKTLTLVDLNEVPIDLCRERLKYYPNEVTYFVNDGKSLSQAAGREFDLVVKQECLPNSDPQFSWVYLYQLI